MGSVHPLILKPLTLGATRSSTGPGASSSTDPGASSSTDPGLLAGVAVLVIVLVLAGSCCVASTPYPVEVYKS